jgi:hypothetical protein
MRQTMSEYGPYGRGPLEIVADPPKGIFLPSNYDEYKGYRLTCVRDGLGLWKAEAIDGSELPTSLQGAFTSLSILRRLVDTHVGKTDGH